jgi:ribosomal protein S18 acetylase RimI-like enzyme
MPFRALPTTMTSEVRPFRLEDVPALLKLMISLAEFERYADRFAVTEADLIERGLSTDPQFYALVAERDKVLVGYAVYYLIPFTFTLEPRAVMKELFVVESARGVGVGGLLFDALCTEARARGANEVHWLVLPSNEAATRFYRAHGGARDDEWDRWFVAL